MTCCQRKEILLKCLFQEWRLCTGEEGIRRRYGEDKLIATSFETRMGRRNFGTKQFRRGSLSPVPRAHIISKVRSCSPSQMFLTLSAHAFTQFHKEGSKQQMFQPAQTRTYGPRQRFFAEARPLLFSSRFPFTRWAVPGFFLTAHCGCRPRKRRAVRNVRARACGYVVRCVCACEKRGASVAGVAGLCLAPPERVCSGSD